jgi:hypothetical protein
MNFEFPKSKIETRTLKPAGMRHRKAFFRN